MGKENERENGGTGTEIQPAPKKGRKRISSDDTRTSEENTRGTGTGTGTGRTTDTEKADSEGKSVEPVELVQVNSSVPAPEVKPAKKKVRKKRTVKKAEPVFSSTQISTFLIAVTGIIASREGLEIFALNEFEAQQIAEPLSQMIVDSGYSEKVGKYANPIALVTACVMIFAPKFIIFSQQQKAKKIEKSGGLKIESVDKERKTSGSNRRSDSGTNEGSKSHSQINDTSILASIPSIA